MIALLIVMTTPMAVLVARPQPGLWSVRTLARGSDRPRIELKCLDAAGWLIGALPPIMTAGCAATVTLPVDVRCARRGRLIVTGMAGAGEFSIVARRSGRVGINPSASLTIVAEGQRVADACK